MVAAAASRRPIRRWSNGWARRCCSQPPSAWRSARAKILARRGDLDDAERLAREAVELVAETDVLNMRAYVLVSLAQVLVAADRAEEAAEPAAEGVRLYEAKGNVVAAEKARAVVAPGALKTGAA